MQITWAILTGEYPPDPGGVSDYTGQLAKALVEAGDRVHVFAPPMKSPRIVSRGGPADGVQVMRLDDTFGPRGIARLSRELSQLASARTRVLVQYVPQAFGFRGMNLLMSSWLALVGDLPIDVMFHEVAMPLEPNRAFRQNALAHVQRFMARSVARSAERIFVSTTWWAAVLSMLAPGRAFRSLPVPSNIPAIAVGCAEIRARYVRNDRPFLLGHFGALGQPELIETMVATLQANPGAQFLIIDHRAEQFVARLLARHGELKDRFHGVQGLSNEQVANHLAACDVLVQPYPDGVTTRRSSLMAGLALGLPVVSTRGIGTEDLWQSQAAPMLTDYQPEAIATAVRQLLEDPTRRREVGESGRTLYRERFDLPQTVRKLRAIDSDTM